MAETMGMPGSVCLFFIDFGEDVKSAASRIFRKEVFASVFVYIVVFVSFVLSIVRRSW